VPPSGIAELIEAFAEHPDAAVVGGPNLTPPDDPPFAQLAGEVLASRWGTGVTRARYASLRARPACERHLILCNLAVRRKVFDRGLRFPVLFGGEENILLGHADRHGHLCWYVPSLWVHHRRRATLGGYIEQVHRYGRGRAQALVHAPKTFHVAYLVPVAWLSYLLALPLLVPFGAWAWLPLGAYALGIGGASLRAAIARRRPAWLLGLPALFALTHLVYAAGLVAGLLAELVRAVAGRRRPTAQARRVEHQARG